MTSPRGTRAAGQPGGKDGSAGPHAGADPADPAETVTAEAMHAGAGPADASSADTGAADAQGAGGLQGDAARTAGATTVQVPASTPDRAEQRRLAHRPGSRAEAI